MRNSMGNRLLSIFFTMLVCIVAVFSCYCLPAFANGTEQGTSGEGDNLPSLFRQDSAFSNDSKYPLVIKEGVEYVPLEMFFGFRGVVIEYADDANSFYIQNKNNNRYISFDVKNGYSISQAYGARDLEVESFYNTLYVPAMATAKAVGLNCEVVAVDEASGKYCLRISNSSALKTFDALIEEYIPKKNDSPDADASKAVDTPSDEKPNVNPPKQENPQIEKPMGRRGIYLAIANSPNENTSAILDSLKQSKVKATFFCSGERMLENPSMVRRILIEGHSVGFCMSDETLTLLEESSNPTDVVISDIQKTREIYQRLTKKSTRLFYLPYAMSEDVDAESIYNICGMQSVMPNIECADLSDLSATAIATALNDLIKGEENIELARNHVVMLHSGENSLSVLQRNLEFAYTNRRQVHFYQLTDATVPSSLGLIY